MLLTRMTARRMTERAESVKFVPSDKIPLDIGLGSHIVFICCTYSWSVYRHNVYGYTSILFTNKDNFMTSSRFHG